MDWQELRGFDHGTAGPYLDGYQGRMPPTPSAREASEALYDSPGLIHNKGAIPYHAKEAIGTAKYVPPSSPRPFSKAGTNSPRMTSAGQRLVTSGGISSAAGRSILDVPVEKCDLPDPTAAFFKTEKWREKGVDRWPNTAATEIMRQPRQFVKAEEVVPVQRMTTNPQSSIHGELWTRSLRTKGLEIERVGLHNQNVATSTFAVMFDQDGTGWSGKTNTQGFRRPRGGRYGPNIKDWVERPVAQGKYHIDHMGGSRYAMNMTPRPCNLNSVETMKSPRALSGER